MPPVRPAAGEKIEAATLFFGSIQLNAVIIFSKKRKKTISYAVRYEANETDSEDSIGLKKAPVLFVRAPASLSIKEIQAVLSNNEENISALLQKAAAKEEAAEQKSKQTYKNGSIFHYMGRTYSLQLVYEEDVKKIQVRLLDGRLLVHLPKKMIDLPDTEKEKKIKKAVEAFYIEQADVFFNSRVDYFAEKYLDLIGKKPKSVKAASYKSKWGCCTYQNDIQLNWALIQAETPIIDYVIVHELCHIRHKNHSKDFWNLVGTIDPKYKEKRQELKENGWILGMK